MKRADTVIPPCAPRMRIGLMGGSFNPAHNGHRQIALTALRRLNLDAVWWLVSPANPLKNPNDLASHAERIAQTRTQARHSRFRVTGLEAALGTRYSIDTVRALKQRCKGVHFVWVMGADNLTSFHKWRNWQEFARTLPIAVIDRPGATLTPLNSRVAHRFRNERLKSFHERDLITATPPAWVFISAPRLKLSSTMIREKKSPDNLKNSP